MHRHDSSPQLFDNLNHAIKSVDLPLYSSYKPYFKIIGLIRCVIHNLRQVQLVPFEEKCIVYLKKVKWCGRIIDVKLMNWTQRI